MQQNAMQRIAATMRSLSLKKRKNPTHGGDHTPPTQQPPYSDAGQNQHCDRLLMRPHPHHNVEAHQQSIEIQRRIKRNIFKGYNIDWRSIPAVADDDDYDDKSQRLSSESSLSCPSFEKILDTFRLPWPRSSPSPQSSGLPATEDDFLDTIG